jgi:hypothetical protein
MENKKPTETPPQKKKVRVIDSLWTFFVATAFLGPFALPLLWRNPRFKVRNKILGSLVIILLTWALMKIFGDVLSDLDKQIELLKEIS